MKPWCEKISTEREFSNAKSGKPQGKRTQDFKEQKKGGEKSKENCSLLER